MSPRRRSDLAATSRAARRSDALDDLDGLAAHTDRGATRWFSQDAACAQRDVAKARSGFFRHSSALVILRQ
jgi:hypothetical protein